MTPRGIICLVLLLIVIALTWRDEIYIWLNKNFSDFKTNEDKTNDKKEND